MTALTFYGGVNEIGGNKILLKDGDTQVLLDFGMSFGRAKKYFDTFMQPRKFNGIRDLLEFGLLPDLKGLYRCDYMEHCGFPPESEANFDGVLLTRLMSRETWQHITRYAGDVFSIYAHLSVTRTLQARDAREKAQHRQESE